MYNTTYDINKFTEAERKEVDRVAREIENEDSKGNRHVAEERGQVQLRDNDISNEEN